MRRGPMKALLTLAVFFVLACDGETTDDGGPDAGRHDSGTDSPDSGGTDGGRADGGRVDGGPRDAGPLSCGSLTMPALTYQDVLASGDWTGYNPVALAQPPGESADLYVVTQEGLIVIVRGGAIVTPPFLD